MEISIKSNMLSVSNERLIHPHVIRGNQMHAWYMTRPLSFACCKDFLVSYYRLNRTSRPVAGGRWRVYALKGLRRKCSAFLQRTLGPL